MGNDLFNFSAHFPMPYTGRTGKMRNFAAKTLPASCKPGGTTAKSPEVKGPQAVFLSEKCEGELTFVSIPENKKIVKDIYQGRRDQDAIIYHNRGQ